ncbi:MAG: DDE-type integrase/transposase/recombinase [Spirochaetaceae bacterium]|nr:DDE-type integrase/transposase/recombinase [Spirochaetaceae bacterium]
MANAPDDDPRQAVALFRYGLIADLVNLPPGTPGIGARLRAKAERDYDIPGTHRTRVAAETLRDWLKRYRDGGFDALYPKPRADRGRPRRLSAETAELLISVKLANPAWSVRAVIDEARRQGVADDIRLAPSTVHRLLAREGLLDRDAQQPVADRRRFAHRYAGELWMSDVMHGPAVRDGRRRRKTYLIAFLDDATRVIPYAAFAFAENTAAFLPALKQAVMRRGLPNRLYVDNGAAYRSRHLALVCARLGIALIHAKPFQPAAKGKIERWFRTLREGWLNHLDRDARDSLEDLNRRLWAWIEGEYHQAPHRGLDGDTPLDRWATAGADVRYPDPGPAFDDVFLFEHKRRVMKDRTVSLHGRLYEVDAVLVGKTVVLRHDPAAPPGRPLRVVLDGTPAGDATVLDAYANTAVRRVRPSSHIETDQPAPEPPPSRIAMRNLDREHKNRDQRND